MPKAKGCEKLEFQGRREGRLETRKPFRLFQFPCLFFRQSRIVAPGRLKNETQAQTPSISFS